MVDLEQELKRQARDSELQYDRSTLRLDVISFAADGEGCTGVAQRTILEPTVLSGGLKEGKLPTELVQTMPGCELVVLLGLGSLKLTADAGVKAAVDVFVQEGRPECTPAFFTVRFGSFHFRFTDDKGVVHDVVAPIGGDTSPQFEDADGNTRSSETGNIVTSGSASDTVALSMDAAAAISTIAQGIGHDLRFQNERVTVAQSLLVNKGVSIDVSARATDECACFASAESLLRP